MWEVRTFDVWGNEEDGYEINEVFKAGQLVADPGASDKDLWTALCEQGFARGPFERARFEDNGEFDFTIYDDKTGEPTFGLRLMTDEELGTEGPNEEEPLRPFFVTKPRGSN